MQLIAIFCAIGAAIVAFIGRLKAAPLVPSYAAKLRTVQEVLEPALWSQAKLARYLYNVVAVHGGIAASPSAPLVDLYNNLGNAADTLEKAHTGLIESDLLDFSATIADAARARLWLLASVLLAAASAALQVLVLWSDKGC